MVAAAEDNILSVFVVAGRASPEPAAWAWEPWLLRPEAQPELERPCKGAGQGQDQEANDQLQLQEGNQAVRRLVLSR